MYVFSSTSLFYIYRERGGGMKKFNIFIDEILSLGVEEEKE